MEVELKFRAPKDIEERITLIGAKKISEQDERDLHYDRNGELLAKGITLRVRHTADKKELTYKGPQTRTDIKAVEEINISVEGDIDKALNNIGFSEDKLVTKEKHRVTYKLDDININIDDVKDLGKFVELEIITNDVDTGKKCLLDMASKLKLKNPITKSYPKMLRELNTSGD
jgi:adenylate cyclase class 2